MARAVRIVAASRFGEGTTTRAKTVDIKNNCMC